MRVKENTMNLLIVIVICIASLISSATASPRQKKVRPAHLSKPRKVYLDYSRSATDQPVSNEVHRQLESVPNSKDEVKEPMRLLHQRRKTVSFGKKVAGRKKAGKRGKKVFRHSKRNRSSHAKANDNHAASDEAEDASESPSLEETVVEKGMEMAENLSDEAQEEEEEGSDDSPSNKEIKLDIAPDKGWKTEDMFLPSGYHIDAAVEEEEKSPTQEAPTPFTYPAGIGGVLMNGCWGTDYTETDPCYNSKTTANNCDDMMEGAGFLGVGFDGRGKYSPDSRKMSLIQRLCANEATYAGEDVPDTMNVHGIYDTTASLITFESRAEYSKFLQQEAGISGSYFGFSAGVQEAWGESSESSSQKYLAVMDVDVSRYEIFMDEVKPQDLSLSFLREFMNLPLSYFSTGAPLLYQNFIQRWGTHYIKSAKFGGQLEIRKTMDAKEASSKKEFEVEMEVEYKTLFASVGAKASARKGESSRKQSKTTSTSIVAQGGSQEIASILSDVYSPTFKTEFKHWLQTIPSYPKAFKFHMGSITDLLNFRANDLFSDEKVTWGCEGNAVNVKTEVRDGTTVKYYEVLGANNTKTKHYCEFDSRQALEYAIQRRRTSLLRAMEIYMEEGPISISDTELGACTYPKRDDEEDDDDLDMPPSHPSWKQIINDNLQFRISFDMLDDLSSTLRSVLDIGRNTSRFIRFQDRWETSDRDGNFHLYGAFDNGDSKDISKYKISVFGLVLTYNEAQGILFLSPEDYNESKTFFPDLGKNMIGIALARLEMQDETPVKRAALPSDGPLKPCKLYWSNALRLDPTDSKGKCLHFTASTEGTMFVVFAALPKLNTTWYTIEISRVRAAIYKGTQIKTQTTNVNALALGDYSLHQSYFICITETEISTVIEYGKSLGTSDSGDIYLNLIDSTNHLNVRFYAFGNDEKPAKVMDAHIVSRSLTQADCKGDTTRDKELDMCVQKCHPFCDPLAGCKRPDDPRVPEGCYACRVGVDPETNECIAKCPTRKTLTRDKRCIPSSDVRLRPTDDYGPVEIGDVPTMRELTLCLWLKIEGTWLKQGAKGIYLVRYQQDSLDNFFEFYLDEASRYGGKPEKIALQFSIGGSGNHREFLDGLDNNKWQQLCVTWSGFTAVVTYYRNGTRLHASEYRVGEMKGGGTLKLGGLLTTGTGKRSMSISVTELNLWDKVLSDQEIANNVRRCDAGKGNVKEWHKWFDAAEKKFGVRSNPSYCRPFRRF